jgi:hypothetical protein
MTATQEDENLSDHHRSLAPFLEAVNSADLFTVAVRGHQHLDDLACELISESLPEPHALEIARLTFQLKVDVLIALRALPFALRPVFGKINYIRNMYVHSTSASLTEGEALDLYNVIPCEARANMEEEYKRDPHYVLSRAMGILFASLAGAIRRLRDQRAADSAFAEIVDEVCISESQYTEDTKKYLCELDERVRERILEDRRRRAVDGEY